MDPHSGRFEEIDEDKAMQQLSKMKRELDVQQMALLAERGKPGLIPFDVGEIIDVKGHPFEVKKITKKDLILRAIPKP